MKLYATVASERATKGQGGNDYIRIELKGGSASNSYTEYIIEYNESGLLVIDSDMNELLSTGGRFIGDNRKGEKQKGENYKMIGFPERENIILGYTSDVDAFIKESINNGWKRENIKAIKQ